MEALFNILSFGTEIQTILAGLVGAVVVLVVTFFKGRRDANRDNQAKADAAYIETLRRMRDEEENHVGDDPAVARDFLHQRNKPKRRL